MKRKPPILKSYKITLKFLLVLFILFSQDMVYSQIKIREKLEINPKPGKSHLINSTMQVSHTMRIATHWDAVAVYANNHFWNANISGRLVVRDIHNGSIIIATSAWTSGWPAGDMSISINNAVCNYMVEMQFKGFYDLYQFLNIKTNVYWDGIFAEGFTDKVQSDYYYNGARFGGGAGFYGFSQTYGGMSFIAGYEPYMSNSYCFNMPLGIKYTCDGGIFYPQKDPLTITILQGADLFWFHNLETTGHYEKTVSGLPGSMKSYELVPKVPLPRMDSLEVILQFQINDDIRTCSRKLYNLSSGYIFGLSSSNRLSHNGRTEIEGVLYNDCGEIPTDVTMKAEIKKGSQYGVLVDPLSGNSGKVLTGINVSENCAYLSFLANGVPAAVEDTIIVQLSTSNDNIYPETIRFIIDREPIKISLEPSAISPGDTAVIKFEKWDFDNKYYTEMPPELTYEIGIQEGCGAGEILLKDGRKTNYYKGYSSSITRLKFIAADSLAADNTSVVFRFGYYGNFSALKAFEETTFEKSSLEKMDTSTNSSKDSSKLNPGIKKAETHSDLLNRVKEDKRFGRLSPVARETVLAILENRMAKVSAADTSVKAHSLAMAGDNGQTCSGVNYQFPEKCSATELIVKPIDIMLGETKYFQTKLNDKNELIIEEVKAEPGKEPQCTGIKEDVWKSNPVAAISGNKCGVYWDKKSPSGNNLPAGLIRVVGRYWEKDKTYKDKLTASDASNKSAKIIVDVIKPGKLGSSNNYANDVWGKQICIDDICIEAGGKNGIPPQLIKGQMQKETNFRNVFRYEPFVDIDCQKNPKTRRELFEDYNYFAVSSNNMGTIAIPAAHNNVSPIQYPNQPVKISDFLVANIGQYIQRPNIANKNMPIVVGDSKKELTNPLQDAYNQASGSPDDPSKNALKKPLSTAIEELKKLLKSGEYEDGSRYAQTRIVASYGMLQQTFYDASYKKLAGFCVSNQNQSPELLNEKDYSIRSYSERILKVLNNKAGSIWNEGYEKGWLKVLSGYNPGEPGYGNDVLNNSKSFLPVK